MAKRKKSNPGKLGFKKTVKFLEKYEVQDHSGIVFEKGSVHTLSYSSAMHWIRRKKAIEYFEKAEKPMENSSVKKKGPGRPKKKLVEEKPVLETLEITPLDEEPEIENPEFTPAPPITATGSTSEVETKEESEETE